MAIISASRRTDIPTFFSEWFINCLKNGKVLVRNPYNIEQVSEIALTKDVIDCIVFWTKNPIPMLPHINTLNDFQIPYYFQFTLTGYGRDIEPNIPDKHKLINTFQKLHKMGNGYIIWRYDPIIFTDRYSPEYHLRAFHSIASQLSGFTDKCVISFVDTYLFNQNEFIKMGARQTTKDELTSFCCSLVEIANHYGISIGTCAEVIDLDACGIVHNRCIDPDYIEKIIGVPIKNKKDLTQRKECGCIESIDIGSYNTCMNGCKYCYACKERDKIESNFANYNPNSLMLCDSLTGHEKVTKRIMRSMKK